jgi:hypothetical protein
VTVWPITFRSQKTAPSRTGASAVTRPLSFLALIVCLSAGQASAGVTVACYRGPIPRLPVINGPEKVFINSIHATYDLTLDQAREIADFVCSDMSVVGDQDRLLELARSRLEGLRLR